MIYPKTFQCDQKLCPAQYLYGLLKFFRSHQSHNPKAVGKANIQKCVYFIEFSLKT